MKKCSRCKKILSESQFYKLGERLQSNCKICDKLRQQSASYKQSRREYRAARKSRAREYAAQHYRENKSKRVEQNKLNRESIRDYIRRVKHNKKCVDCGISYPYWIMQFDHVRGKKLFNLSTAPGKAGKEKVDIEISKCDIVCANCHFDRTHRRGGPRKSKTN